MRQSEIVAYTAVCEEDSRWIKSYLTEVERLDLLFAIHLDRCSSVTKRRLVNHARCIGYTEQNNAGIEFTEQHKQGVFNLVEDSGAKWALAWDIDETWEQSAPEKLAQLLRLDCDRVEVLWRSLWDTSLQIRVDGPFSVHYRVKAYNLLSSVCWIFDHAITNGAKAFRSQDHSPHQLQEIAKHSPPDLAFLKVETNLVRLDIVCLHWGLMTQEDRELHRTRWDRIYTKAVGANPYGFWDFACNRDIKPVLENHRYFE